MWLETTAQLTSLYATSSLCISWLLTNVMPSSVKQRALNSRQQIRLEKGPKLFQSFHFCLNKVCKFFPVIFFHICVTSIRILHPGTLNLLFPWKLAQNPKSWDGQKSCRSIWFRFWWCPAMKFGPFMPELALRVCISTFPWQPFEIFKICFRKSVLWPGQGLPAKFRSDRSINGNGVD